MDALTLAASQFYKEKSRPDGREFSEHAAVVVEHHKNSVAGVGATVTANLRASTTIRYGGTVVTCTAKARLVHLHPYAKPAFGDYFRIVQSGVDDRDDSPLPRKISEILELSEAFDLKNLLTFTRPSGAVDIDMVDSSESATCKWIWRIFVDFYVVRSDGCLLPSSLLSVLSAIGHLKVPDVKISPDYVCDHTGVLADETEFDLRFENEKFHLLSIGSNELRRVSISAVVAPRPNDRLQVQTFPFAFTFAFIPDAGADVENKQKSNSKNGKGSNDNVDQYDDFCLADPSAVEEALCCSTITIVCTNNKIFNLSTTGCGLSFASSNGAELLTCLVNKAQERAEKLLKLCSSNKK